MATPPDFTAGSVLTAAQMNAVGLWRITPTVSGTGMALSGSEIVMTDVTAGEIRSVFSSSFRNYRVLVTHNFSTGGGIKLEMLSGTNTVESGSVYKYAGIGYVSSGAAYNDGNSNNTSFLYPNQGGDTDAGSASFIMEFMNPNAAARTWIHTTGGFEWIDGTVYKRDYSCEVNTATQYTGFKLSTTAGNIDGSISIYGYKK